MLTPEQFRMRDAQAQPGVAVEDNRPQVGRGHGELNQAKGAANPHADAGQHRNPYQGGDRARVGRGQPDRCRRRTQRHRQRGQAHLGSAVDIGQPLFPIADPGGGVGEHPGVRGDHQCVELSER